MTLILTPIRKIPFVHPGDDLATIITDHLSEQSLSIEDGDIFVLAQKIVSKSENRYVPLSKVIPGEDARIIAQKIEKDPRLVQLILDESISVLRTRPGTIIVEHKLGFICANAGIDHSNVDSPTGQLDEWVLLLPIDPDASAKAIRDRIFQIAGRNVGVMIIDSHGRAWRNGVVGVTIGLAGVPGIIDMRGKPDLFGVQLRVTQIAAADELAAAASLVMGQADESTPVIHVRGFPYPLRESTLRELIRPKEFDLFR
ncbi:MAG TPA: coenzyme F420-0:L-glutamate ligase [Anaerolineaceae bacterium]